MHLHRFAAVLTVSCLFSLPAWAQQVVASAASPGNVISVDVQLDGGKLAYGIKRKGKDIIGMSRLGFNLANAMVLNKVDLLPYVDFDRERARDFATRLNKELAVFEVSCRDGSGLEGWYQWLRDMRASKL